MSITIDGTTDTITATGGTISFDNENLTTSGTTTTNALTIAGLDCTGSANGGALTADASGAVSCSNDDGGSGDDLGDHIADQNIQLNGNLLSGDGDNEGVWVSTNGNVGIGTFVPAELLHVAGNIRLDAAGQLQFGSATVRLIEIAGNLDIDANDILIDAATQDVEIEAGDDIFLLPDDDLRIEPLGFMRVEGTNVGISNSGLSSPTHLLHVNGVARSTQSTWATSSDRRVKTNVRPLDGGLDRIKEFNPVIYEYTAAYQSGNEDLAGPRMGFIAQEVAAVDPTMVNTVSEVFGDTTIDDFHVLSNSNMIPLLVDAVKALSDQIDQLKTVVCRDHPDFEACD